MFTPVVYPAVQVAGVWGQIATWTHPSFLSRIVGGFMSAAIALRLPDANRDLVLKMLVAESAEMGSSIADAFASLRAVVGAVGNMQGRLLHHAHKALWTAMRAVRQEGSTFIS
jgi:hypothetical protein